MLIMHEHLTRCGTATEQMLRYYIIKVVKMQAFFI